MGFRHRPYDPPGVVDEGHPEATTRANRLLATWIRELLGVESVSMRLLFGS